MLIDTKFLFLSEPLYINHFYHQIKRSSRLHQLHRKNKASERRNIYFNGRYWFIYKYTPSTFPPHSKAPPRRVVEYYTFNASK